MSLFDHILAEWASMKTVEKASLATGALAAFAAFLNALMSLFNGWLENRRLKIVLRPYDFANVMSGNYYLFELKIVNPAKASNSIREVLCYVDCREQPCMTDPLELLANPIDGYRQINGWVLLPARVVSTMADETTISFAFVPVRDRRIRIKFDRTHFP